ncbi:MAG: flavin reductase family protein [Alphaproteobacteria bacterium]|nr:flavin reductase family protein [Alphaproteobacteria bacterium]
MRKKSLPLSDVYRLLEPGPVVLITTADKGRADIMTQSWHTMIDFEPPLIGCVISNRNFSFGPLMKTKECTINIPTVELSSAVAGCGNTSGRDTDKFKRFHLTPVAASRVKAPLIDECYASLECRVIDAKMAGKYNLFILKVLKAWIDPAQKNPKTLHHRGNGKFMVAGKTVTLRSRAK